LGEKIPGYDSVEKITEKFYHQRMKQINEFENFLVENGTIVLKFYLNISKEEQKDRLLRRLDKPEKNWKFSASDLKERKLWEQYMNAYEDMLEKTSTQVAPWHVIPADDKDTARFLVAKIIIEKLESFEFKYPSLNEVEKNNIEIYRQELKNL
jgi:polyphosphate kinase 2 (PPK2 family)